MKDFQEWTKKNEGQFEKHAPPGWAYRGTFGAVLGFGNYDSALIMECSKYGDFDKLREHKDEVWDRLGQEASEFFLPGAGAGHPPARTRRRQGHGAAEKEEVMVRRAGNTGPFPGVMAVRYSHPQSLRWSSRHALRARSKADQVRIDRAGPSRSLPSTDMCKAASRSLMISPSVRLRGAQGNDAARSRDIRPRSRPHRTRVRQTP